MAMCKFPGGFHCRPVVKNQQEGSAICKREILPTPPCLAKSVQPQWGHPMGFANNPVQTCEQRSEAKHRDKLSRIRILPNNMHTGFRTRNCCTPQVSKIANCRHTTGCNLSGLKPRKGRKIKPPARHLESTLRSSQPSFSTRKEQKTRTPNKKQTQGKSKPPTNTRPTEEDSDNQTPGPTPTQITEKREKTSICFFRLRRFCFETPPPGSDFSKSTVFF